MDLLNKSKTFNLLSFLYFLLLPFVFFSSISDPFLLARQFLTTVFLFFVLFFLFTKNKAIDFYTADTTVILFFGFISFCVFSFAKSQIPDLSHATLSKYLIYFLFFLLIRHLTINNLLDVEKIKSHVIVFGSLATAIALLALLNKTIDGYNFFRKITVVTGTFGNKNFLSSILFFCFPFYFMGIAMSKKIKMISVTAIVFSILLLLMLRTRTVLIALSFYLFFVFMLEIKTRVSKKSYYWFIIAVIGTTAIGAWFLFSIKSNMLSPSGIREHYFSRLLSSGTFYERLEFWKQSIYMTTDNFFNGVGLGNWINTYPKYGLHHFSDANILNGRMMVGNPHNDFLLVLSEIGIFGFLCYIGIFISILYQAYWLAKNEENSTDQKNAGYLFFFFVCYLIVAFFDFPITRIEHQILLLVAFSIINAKYIKAKSIKRIAIPSRIFFLSSLFLLLYSATVLFYKINGEIHLSKALEAEKKLDNTTAIFEFNKAKNYCLSTDNFAIPLDWHIGRIQYNQGNFDESLNYFLDAYSVNPYNLVVNNELGSAYIKNGETAYGIKHYKEALTISPNYEDARINLAATYFNDNEYEKAFQTIVKCENNSKNKSYKQILTPIVEKKLNITLIRINNQNLNNYLKSKIKTEADLLSLYFGYNKNILTFDEYIKSLIP